MKKIAAISLSLVMFSMLFVSVIPSSADADSTGFDVEFDLKGTHHETHFDGPVDQIVVFGYAAALTVLDTNQASKLYASDKYADDAYAEKGLTRDSEEVANLSTANVDSIYAFLTQAVHDNELSIHDAIILTTMSSPAQTLYNKLTTDAGFDHVVFYGSMTEYADIIQCVKEIEMILGADGTLHEAMETKLANINTAVGSADKVDAMFVWYSPTSGWGYGNTGSLSVTMINAAGGNNIGYNSGSTSSIIYDKSGVVQRLADSPEAVIFLDSGFTRSYGGTLQQFVDEVMGGNLGKHKLVVSEHAWNNYCPESADGLVKMAHVLHPDLIDADVRVYTAADFEENSETNIVLYAGIGIAIIVIAGLAVFLLRGRSTV